MAPTNALTGLVLLAAVTGDLVGVGMTTRSLAVGADIDTEFTVPAVSGEYVVDITTNDSTTPAEILTPPTDENHEETLIAFDSEGQISEIVVGNTTYSVEYNEAGEGVAIEGYGRRDRSRRAQSVPTEETQDCREECIELATLICDSLYDACDREDLLGQLCVASGVCADLDLLCNEDGLQANCINQCSLSCDPDFPVEDECPADQICCPVLRICEVPIVSGGCGDPHMTGFLGQKFDFTGEDDAWYCLVEDGPSMHVNMRVTTPVPSLPEVTYITGLTVATVDFEGVRHTVEIKVSNPHSLQSACPAGVSPCLADGALTVKLDGEKALVSPGTATLGPGVAISAVNLPGACRSFGFEKYWELKKIENDGRKLDLLGFMQDMGEWILGDPTATNMAECTEYVASAGESGLFAHESEHASFQIMTSAGTLRLSHGRLHQLAVRDPTDQFDIPDHISWQMNIALDHHDVSMDATGILGETVVPTLDENGNFIMKGTRAIRGSQEDYHVEGPLETAFAQRNRPQ